MDKPSGQGRRDVSTTLDMTSGGKALDMTEGVNTRRDNIGGTLDVTSGRELFLKFEYNLAAFVVINIEDEIATETGGMTLDKGQT